MVGWSWDEGEARTVTQIIHLLTTFSSSRTLGNIRTVTRTLHIWPPAMFCFTHDTQPTFLLPRDTQNRDFWYSGNTCGTQKKIKKIHHTHHTQISLYFLFTPVHSTLLVITTTAKILPLCHPDWSRGCFQNITRDPPTCMSAVWSQPFAVPSNVLYQA